MNAVRLIQQPNRARVHITVARGGSVVGIVRPYRKGWQVLVCGHIEYHRSLDRATKRAVEIAEEN